MLRLSSLIQWASRHRKLAAGPAGTPAEEIFPNREGCRPQPIDEQPTDASNPTGLLRLLDAATAHGMADWQPPGQPELSLEAGTPPWDATEEIIELPSGGLSYLDCAVKLFPKLAAARQMFICGGVVVELSAEQILQVVRPEAFRSRIESVGRLYTLQDAS